MMRPLVILFAVVVGSASAHGGPRAADLAMRWDEGEMSRDASMWTTDITVTGRVVHYDATYSGRNAGMPGTRPVHAVGRVKDPAKLAAALAALDAITPPPPAKPEPDREPEGGYASEGCLTRGKATRCASHGTGDPTAEYQAMAAVRAAITDGIPLSPQL